jgi:hypothetical protein
VGVAVQLVQGEFWDDQAEALGRLNLAPGKGRIVQELAPLDAGDPLVGVGGLADAGTPLGSRLPPLRCRLTLLGRERVDVEEHRGVQDQAVPEERWLWPFRWAELVE